jgi:prophage regulatory protein
MENLLLRPAVLKRAAISTTSLYREMAADRFPRPVRVLRNRVAWRADEVDAWIAERVAERDAAVAGRRKAAAARGRRAASLLAG